jgi:hypothetical protein
MNKKIMKSVLIALFVIVISSTVVPHPGPVHSHVPRTYKVSLDDSIE